MSLEDVEEKKERILLLSDTTYKILCLADSKGFDPSVGAEKLSNMYLALCGPVDFKKLEIERARVKAKEFKLL
ncbi:MAG: hypothetical protein HQK50_05275 [Oligoflexia bacterium]|nr:hypothetical protein [Oligoflexia bacterium]MBF0364960.1 hypothetical protein [Oligoflexia bacterium]